MATIKLQDSTEEELRLAINNGDLKVLKEIIQKFRFKDEPSFFRYALGIMASSDEKEVTVKNRKSRRAS